MCREFVVVGGESYKFIEWNNKYLQFIQHLHLFYMVEMV